jgi:hypothetical protein
MSDFDAAPAVDLSDAPVIGGDADYDAGGDTDDLRGDLERELSERDDDAGKGKSKAKDEPASVREDIEAAMSEVEQGGEAKIRADRDAEYDSLVAVTEPFMAELQAHGLSRADGIQRLVNAHSALQRDPVNALAWLVDSYGSGGRISPDQAGVLIERIAAVSGLARVNPDVFSSDMVARRVAVAMENYRAQEQAQRQQAAAQAVPGEVERFASTRGADGQSAYPHFQAVRTQMGALMLAAAQSGQAMTLAEAYDQAVWAHPQLRAGLTKAEQTRAAQQADEARKASVQRARAASTPRTASTAPASAEDDGEGLSVREIVTREFAKRANGSGRRI